MPGPIVSHLEWRGPDLARDKSWIHTLSAAENAEIDAALRVFTATGMGLDDMRQEHFPLPAVAPLIATARDALEKAHGLFLFRGFPAERYGTEELRTIYWGLGRHFGTAVCQSMRGDFLGDVRDIGVDIRSLKGRGYTSNAELTFHTDSTDVTGLFCLRTAKAGGDTRLVSSIAVHNKIARERPDVLETLYQPFWWSLQGQEREGEQPVYQQPIYAVHQGYFTCRYIRAHIMTAQRYPGVPPLTTAQSEALDTLDATARSPELVYAMRFEPGDIQFLNNHVTYHARTEFEDYPEPDKKRHLLRMWLSVPNSRPLPPSFGKIYQDQRPGAVRGGFPGHVAEPRFSTL